MNPADDRGRPARRGVSASEDARGIWRGLRIALLLLVLLIVVGEYWRRKAAENWVSSWRQPEKIAIELIVPLESGEAGQAIVAELEAYSESGEGEATYYALEDWFRREHARYRADRGSFRPLSVYVKEPRPVTALPPDPPRADHDVVTRTSAMRSFLAYFDALEAERSVPELNAIYVVFYPESEGARFAHVHSIADRASRRGFVFAPLSEAGREVAVIDSAHELLHLFGASDKYDGQRCRFPEGYYEPFADPVHPQRFAEIMALGIPVAAGSKEVSNFTFDEVRIGTRTAAEIGWIEEERANRYYEQQDTSAGPTLDE